MTYFGILTVFILPPMVILAAAALWGARRELFQSGRIDLRSRPWRPYLALLVLVILALVYTTPWDNYLVATGVWWYDPELVTGIRIGYVPIEEYTFFVVQTLLTGLWTWAWMRRRRAEHTAENVPPGFRRAALLATLALWAVSTLVLFSGWKPGTYLTIILSWALIPVMIQLAYGADLLLANWRLVLTAILPATLYLWAVDAIAIASGTWTIDPAQTTGMMVGVLPIEEMVFFLLTNVIIVFGFTLMLSPSAEARARRWLAERGTRTALAGGRALDSQD